MAPDLESYRRALTAYSGMPVLSAWVGGSWMHGTADEHSDIDLRLIVVPSARRILLSDHVAETIGLHGPDITVMTPLSFTRMLLKGTPNALEALTVPSDCLLLDMDFLSRLRGYAPGLTTCGTVKAALGNARANMHRLEHGNGPDFRKARKLERETRRLLSCVREVCSADSVPWPARVPIDFAAPLPSLLTDCERLSGSPSFAVLSDEVRAGVEGVVMDVHRRVIDGTLPALGMGGVMNMLDVFARTHYRG